MGKLLVHSAESIDRVGNNMAKTVDKHVLNNGMVLLGEAMEGVGSVAFNFLLPAGAARLPEGCCGAAAVISDWLFRGAGARNSRQLIDVLDGLGLHRNTSVSADHIALGAALEASNLGGALEVYADIVLRPALVPEQFELSKQLAIHDVIGLDDNPRHKVMLSVSEQFYPSPYGRWPIGKLDELQGLTAETTADIIKNRFDCANAVFSVAGKYDFHVVCKQIERLFDVETPRADMTVTPGAAGDRYTHVPHDGAQVHIGLMTQAPPGTSGDYYDINVAVSVLSGGMSSRLFTEVREKRGLCYAVGATYATFKDLASISCYAGTTPDKAQETLDVIIAEFGRLGEGISDGELQRAKVGLKSSLIMQSESSSARAGGIAGDYWLLGRVRSIEEIKQKLEATSIQSVLDCLRNNPFADYTVATVGPKKIDY